MAFDSRRRWIVATLAATALAVAGGVAIAQNPDAAEDAAEGGDVPITDAADLERASRAALEHTGGGAVTDTEIEDEESYYEIEVTLDDGRQVDVQLDEDFVVVGEEAESGTEDD